MEGVTAGEITFDKVVPGADATIVVLIDRQANHSKELTKLAAEGQTSHLVESVIGTSKARFMVFSNRWRSRTMEGVTADRIILDEAQQVLADMVAKDYERKAGMVRLEADEKYTTLGLIQAKCIKELEFELVKVRELTALLLEYRVETLGTDAKRAVDALPGDLTDLDKLVWLGENEYLFRALAFSRPKT